MLFYGDPSSVPKVFFSIQSKQKGGRRIAKGGLLPMHCCQTLSPPIFPNEATLEWNSLTFPDERRTEIGQFINYFWEKYLHVILKVIIASKYSITCRIPVIHLSFLLSHPIESAQQKRHPTPLHAAVTQ